MSKSKQNRMPRKRKSTQKSAPIRRVTSQPRSFPIVGVGASAGGLEAFTELLHHDALKRAIVETRNYADSLIENAREPILVLDEGWRVAVANPAFYKAFDVSPEETEGRLIYELGAGQWNIPKLRELLKDITEKNTRIDDFEVQHDFPHIGQRTRRAWLATDMVCQGIHQCLSLSGVVFEKSASRSLGLSPLAGSRI